MTEMDKLTTYLKRYEIISDKLTEYFNEVKSPDDITRDDFIYHIELLNQTIETQADMLSVHVGINNELVKEKSTISNALRLYANEFGRNVIIKRDMEDGIHFTLTTTLSQVGKDFISIRVETDKDNEYDDQHTRRRTKYQKIRDWFIFLRQSLREP